MHSRHTKTKRGCTNCNGITTEQVLARPGVWLCVRCGRELIEGRGKPDAVLPRKWERN